MDLFQDSQRHKYLNIYTNTHAYALLHTTPTTYSTQTQVEAMLPQIEAVTQKRWNVTTKESGSKN
jgi:hypothetical protein